jgi:hypothetical protein
MLLREVIYELLRNQRLSLLPAFYTASFPASILTAGAVVPINIAIESQCHFVAMYANLTTYAAGPIVATATSPLKVQLTDTGSGRQLFDQAAPVQNVLGGVAAAAGQGNLPFVFPEPWLIRAGGTATVTLTNFGAATVLEADVTLCGYKLYPLKGRLEEI